MVCGTRGHELSLVNLSEIPIQLHEGLRFSRALAAAAFAWGAIEALAVLCESPGGMVSPGGVVQHSAARVPAPPPAPADRRALPPRAARVRRPAHRACLRVTRSPQRRSTRAIAALRLHKRRTAPNPCSTSSHLSDSRSGVAAGNPRLFHARKCVRKRHRIPCLKLLHRHPAACKP